jgi:hypothetical protein
MVTRVVVLNALALGAIVACGGTSTGAPGAGGRSDITTYEQLASNTQLAVSSYRTAMAGSNITPTTCDEIHDQYDARVRPWISRMMQMAGAMDDFMGDHGGGSRADMTCGSATMMDELDHHRSVACTLATVAADRAEAARHADAMSSYARHAWDRCVEMSGAADGGTWGPMMNGCESGSSTCCSGVMRTADCCGADR